MRMNVRGDVREVERMLTRLQRRQVPFATAQALNDTAFAARKAEMVQAEQKLHKPTPFTVKGFQVNKARKSNLRAQVFIEPKRWKYLKWQVEGGTRRATGRGTGVPTEHRKLNRYGNIPGRRKGLVKGKRQFIATIRGISGVWERYGRGGKQVRLLVAFERSVEYAKRFPFYKIAEGVARNTFVRHFNRRLARALRSTR